MMGDHKKSWGISLILNPQREAIYSNPTSKLFTQRVVELFFHRCQQKDGKLNVFCIRWIALFFSMKKYLWQHPANSHATEANSEDQACLSLLPLNTNIFSKLTNTWCCLAHTPAHTPLLLNYLVSEASTQILTSIFCTVKKKGHIAKAISRMRL
jgi:hypothetical protein